MMVFFILRIPEKIHSDNIFYLPLYLYLMGLKLNIDKLLVKGYYNRFAAEIWMWVIFFEWIFKCINH